MIGSVQIIAIVAFCLSAGADSYSLETLKEIWKIRHAILTCTNELNYGCRCDASKDVTCDFKCISLDKRCNDFRDCPLGDDETDCPEKPCHKGQVCCVSGGCATTCDGEMECTDNSDELACEPPVPSECPDQLECPSGECATVCDHMIECNEEPKDCEPLDEKDCRHVCPENRIVCGIEGGCARRCADGAECPDGFDESTCYRKCEEDEVSCELESAPPGCAELCSENTQCEGPDPDWTERNEYCGGSCLSCGLSPGTCIRTESCP